MKISLPAIINPMETTPDILEQKILEKSPELLDLLLVDRTTSNAKKKHNIIWANDNYARLGKGYAPTDEIQVEAITGQNSRLIQPRALKNKEVQKKRTKKHAEVFTPSWIVKKMIDGMDAENPGWNDNLDEFIDRTWLEITCGEAPFIANRYEMESGEPIELKNRTGFLDRKLRRINDEIHGSHECPGEKVDGSHDSPCALRSSLDGSSALHCATAGESPAVSQFARICSPSSASHSHSSNLPVSFNKWFDYVCRAYKASYGFEWSGDSIVLARENLVLTFVDYYRDKWDAEPSLEEVLQIAEIVSYNVFQMDGLKQIIPLSEKEKEIVQEIKKVDLFGNETVEKKTKKEVTPGKRVKVMNWKTGKMEYFGQ